MTKGTLYLVATPIGNLGDISLRAIEVINQNRLIICEDTRRTGKLISFIHQNYPSPLPEIKKEMVVLNDFNEDFKTPQIISRILGGESAIVVSDAGTPLISDPGYKLVQAGINTQIQIVAIPGPTAGITAVIVSGFPPDRVVLWGFLPKKDSGKREIFEKLNRISQVEPVTVAFYESPQRIIKTLEILKNEHPEIQLCLTRELTKIHEEIIRGKAAEILEKLSRPVLGEITIVGRFG